MACEPAQNGAAAVSVFDPVGAPVLRSVDPVQVAKFLMERERYELEILFNQADFPTLKALPHTASIDRTLLKSLFFMGEFGNIAKGVESASSLNDEHIKAYVQSPVNRTDKTVDHVAIEKVLADVTMPVEIADADARITTYCADFFERLKSIDCGDSREQNLKKPFACSFPAYRHWLSSDNSVAALSSTSRLRKTSRTLFFFSFKRP